MVTGVTLCLRVSQSYLLKPNLNHGTHNEVEEYLKSQPALDENGKPNTSLFGVKMYKSLKAAKISKKLNTGQCVYYWVDGGTSILLGEAILYFRSTEDE